VRSRSVPNQKRVGLCSGQCYSTTLSGSQFERTLCALSAVAAEASKATEAQLQDLSDAILHDALRMKSAAFHTGVEHGRWLNKTEKDKFNLQHWELERAYRSITELQDKCARLEAEPVTISKVPK